MVKETPVNYYIRLEHIKEDLECLPFITKNIEFDIHLGRTDNKKHIVLDGDQMELVNFYEGGKCL